MLMRELPHWPSGGRSIDDLLTEDERQALRRDLADMARKRRRAEAEASRFWFI